MDAIWEVLNEHTDYGCMNYGAVLVAYLCLGYPNFAAFHGRSLALVDTNCLRLFHQSSHVNIRTLLTRFSEHGNRLRACQQSSNEASSCSTPDQGAQRSHCARHVAGVAISWYEFCAIDFIVQSSWCQVRVCRVGLCERVDDCATPCKILDLDAARDLRTGVINRVG